MYAIANIFDVLSFKINNIDNMFVLGSMHSPNPCGGCFCFIREARAHSKTKSTWCGSSCSMYLCMPYYKIYSPPQIPMFNCFLSKFSMKSPKNRFITSVMTLSKTIFSGGSGDALFHFPTKICISLTVGNTRLIIQNKIVGFFCCKYIQASVLYIK